MPARRIASHIAFATLPFALAACVTYPFVSEDGTSGEIDGSPSVGTSDNGNGNGTGTGTTNSNANGTNQNSNGADELPTSPTGDVAQELCNNFIVISERDGSRVLHVYALVGDGSLANWVAGDDVGFDAESGALVNFEGSQHVTAQPIGEYGGNTLLLDYNSVVLTITLQNGAVWVYELDDEEEVRQWRTNSDLITQVDVDSTHAIIINRTRCTSIPGSSQ